MFNDVSNCYYITVSGNSTAGTYVIDERLILYPPCSVDEETKQEKVKNKREKKEKSIVAMYIQRKIAQ